MELKGAVVAIAGASSGIGLATARAFSKAGGHVSLAARRRDRLDSLVGELEKTGARALAVSADVAIEADVHRFVEETVRAFGRIDVMINNAGFGIRGKVEETPSADFERLMKTNFMGTVYGCQAALKHMRTQNRGVIVNVSSIVGHRALPGSGAYAATKAAQISLTESLRVELRGTGITALSVHPIATITEFGEVALRESSGRKGAPLGPRQTAEHVADTIVDAVRHPRPEVHPYWPARAAVAVNALFPSVIDWWLGRSTKP